MQCITVATWSNVIHYTKGFSSPAHTMLMSPVLVKYGIAREGFSSSLTYNIFSFKYKDCVKWAISIFEGKGYPKCGFCWKKCRLTFKLNNISLKFILPLFIHAPFSKHFKLEFKFKTHQNIIFAKLRHVGTLGSSSKQKIPFLKLSRYSRWQRYHFWDVERS